MRALVTGLTGFTGGYLRRELEAHGYEVLGLEGDTSRRVDICDQEAVEVAVRAIRPDAVFHLASQTLASASWQRPKETFEVNAIGAINLLEAVRTIVPEARVLLVGSSDQYGLSGAGGTAISEETPQTPRTPYAISKWAQEYIGKLYADSYGMYVCMTRTFSCGGIGLRKGLVLSDFACGVASVEAGLADKVTVGNLDSERDFTHIEDIVRAYRLIIERGVPGEVYNVGSGVVHSIREVLQTLIAMASCPIPVSESPGKKRPKDMRGSPCDHRKLTGQTGWVPKIPFEKILADVLLDWRIKLNVQQNKEEDR